MKRLASDFGRLIQRECSLHTRIDAFSLARRTVKTTTVLPTVGTDRFSTVVNVAGSLPRRRLLTSSSSFQTPPEPESKPPSAVPTLASKEGASKSLKGPRITSKKGYLERENMIRETQKAVRQYYKEGMYQVCY